MDWVNTLYLKVESRKLELEQTNRSLQALFNAWPHPEKEEKLNDGILNNQNTDPKVKEVSPTPDLTAEEKESVGLVDKLLQKAQKARDVQKKIEEPKRSTNLRDTQHKSSDNTNKPTVQDKKVLAAKNGVVKASTLNKQTQNSNSNQGYEDKNVQACSLVKTRNNTEQSRKVPSSMSVKNSDTKIVGKQGLGRGSVRDGGMVYKSAGRRVTPAHVSAPFQTNPRLTSAKLKTEYRSSTGKVLTAARNSAGQNARGKGGYSAPLKRPASKEPVKQSTSSQKLPPQTQAQENLNNSANSDGSSDISSVDSFRDDKIIDACSPRNLPEHQYSESSIKSLGAGSSTDKSQDSLKSVKGQDICMEGSESSKPGEAEELKEDDIGFRLSKEGHSLTLPGKLRKLGGMNRKLREKIYTQNVTKKVDSPQPMNQFASLLQHTFEEPDIYTVQMVAKQADYLFNVYRNLTNLLENLYLQNLNGESPIEHVLWAKKSMEYILTSFHETENQIRSINLGILKSIDSYDGNQRKKITAHSNPSMRIWYPGTDLDFSQHLTLKYRSYRQMERYTSLVHQAQSLQLQINSMDVLAQQTLPLLKSLQPTSSEFVQVLCCCYSMLSTNPNRVPVIVRDIQDDNQEQDTT